MGSRGLKIIRFGDARGIGAIVEHTNFFGIVHTWTLVPKAYMDGTVNEDSWVLDKWVCRETGKWVFRTFSDVTWFYTAQYNTRVSVDGQ